MILRVYKLILKADQVEPFLAAFRVQLTEFFHQSMGCIGMYLFEDTQNPHQYFVLSRWDTMTDLEDTLRSEFYQAMRKRIHAVVIERDRHYHLRCERSDPRAFLPISSESGAARLVLIVEPPDKVGVFSDLFDSFADEHGRQQPGCRSIELFRQIDSPNRVWVYGLYDTQDSLETWVHHPLFFALRETAQADIYERIEAWDLRLRIDDLRYPLSIAKS